MNYYKRGNLYLSLYHNNSRDFFTMEHFYQYCFE